MGELDSAVHWRGVVIVTTCALVLAIGGCVGLAALRKGASSDAVVDKTVEESGQVATDDTMVSGGDNGLAAQTGATDDGDGVVKLDGFEIKTNGVEVEEPERLIDYTTREVGQFTSVEVISSATNEDGDVTYRVSVNGKEAEVTVPAVAESGFDSGEVVIDRTPRQVSLVETDRLVEELGEACATKLFDAWNEYAAGAGLLPSTEVYISSSTVKQEGNALTFVVTSPRGRDGGGWDPNEVTVTYDVASGTFEFAVSRTAGGSATTAAGTPSGTVALDDQTTVKKALGNACGGGLAAAWDAYAASEKLPTSASVGLMPDVELQGAESASFKLRFESDDGKGTVMECACTWSATDGYSFGKPTAV